MKAPKRITHDARLRDCGDRVRQFLETAATLGPKLGALLFQLPPNLKKDIGLFDAFLDTFPPRVCAAFEFRHASWLDDEVYERLRARNLALCVADSEKLSTPVQITANYAYFRLRDEGYTPDDIGRWADVIGERTSACDDVFVYFKHEEAGKGPEFGRMLMERLGCACNEPDDLALGPVAVVAAAARLHVGAVPAMLRHDDGDVGVGRSPPDR